VPGPFPQATRAESTRRRAVRDRPGGDGSGARNDPGTDPEPVAPQFCVPEVARRRYDLVAGRCANSHWPSRPARGTFPIGPAPGRLRRGESRELPARRSFARRGPPGTPGPRVVSLTGGIECLPAPSRFANGRFAILSPGRSFAKFAYQVHPDAGSPGARSLSRTSLRRVVWRAAAASGAVYVFRCTGRVWRQEAYLKASNTGANDHFGHSVASLPRPSRSGPFSKAVPLEVSPAARTTTTPRPAARCISSTDGAARCRAWRRWSSARPMRSRRKPVAKGALPSSHSAR
jgi:hypothetical protein